MRSTETPLMKQSTQGRILMLSLVTRKGQLSTLMERKRVSVWVGARDCVEVSGVIAKFETV